MCLAFTSTRLQTYISLHLRAQLVAFLSYPKIDDGIENCIIFYYIDFLTCRKEMESVL